jgi:imidazolonepropionase-like amidohydrolase
MHRPNIARKFLTQIFVCWVLLAALLFVGLPYPRSQAVRGAVQSAQIIALIGGTVIDGNGGTPIAGGVVLISGNKILRVGNRAQVKVPAAAKVIDITGKYVLPGLIDLHVHYKSWMGEMFLANGVTTVKDLGNDLDWISTVSKEIKDGKATGPRLFYVGDGLDSPPPARDTHVGVSNPLMAKHAVDLERQRGASAIKVREKITVELLRAITEEAHKLGIPVTGHLRSVDAREAAMAGIDGLEHATGLTQALANHPRVADPSLKELQTVISDLKAFSKIDMEKAPDLIKLLVSKKVALIPTLSGWWRMASDRRDQYALEDAQYAANPLLAYVPEDMRKLWATSAIYKLKSADDLTAIQAGYKKLQQILQWQYKSGGKVLAGSDTLVSVPGLSLQRELEFLFDAGFTPIQAITMATRDNAQFLGKGRELGTIVAGKLADLLVVSADPLADISNTQRVAMVIKDGKVLDTAYHADYSIPTPEPKITRPVWLERELQRYESANPKP